MSNRDMRPRCNQVLDILSETCDSPHAHACELFQLLSEQLADLQAEVGAQFILAQTGHALPRLDAYVLDRVGERADLDTYDDSQRAQIQLLSRALPPTWDAYSGWTVRDWD